MKCIKLYMFLQLDLIIFYFISFYR